MEHTTISSLLGFLAALESKLVEIEPANSRTKILDDQFRCCRFGLMMIWLGFCAAGSKRPWSVDFCETAKHDFSQLSHASFFCATGDFHSTKSRCRRGRVRDAFLFPIATKGIEEHSLPFPWSLDLLEAIVKSNVGREGESRSQKGENSRSR